MANNAYEERVKLLITVLPVINEFPQLALKGGTAINLFVQQGMPTECGYRCSLFTN